MIYAGHPDQWFGPTSYACCGEDLAVAQLFRFMGIEKPSYLDIGAHHPFTISNTALFYSRGSRGVNVEANPNLIWAFHQNRPEDVNVCVGVGIESGFKKFYMWDEYSGRNTFSEEASKDMEVMTKVIDLQVSTLADIVEQHCKGQFPDFLSMDIEGSDFDVLGSADFSMSSPKVICVEVQTGQTELFVKMMKAKGYMPVCRLVANIIFLREEFKTKCHIPIQLP